MDKPFASIVDFFDLLEDQIYRNRHGQNGTNGQEYFFSPKMPVQPFAAPNAQINNNAHLNGGTRQTGGCIECFVVVFLRRLLLAHFCWLTAFWA